MELLVSLVGLLIGALGAVPVLRGLADRLRRRYARRRWSADAHVERGHISHLIHYGFESWRQVVDVDDAGGARHRCDVKIVNIHDKLLRDISFPVYADTADLPAARLAPWATMSRRRLTTDVEDWIPARARGRIRIHLEPPIAPGQARRLHWGYEVPSTFAPGDEYYNLDVANPTDKATLEFRFGEAWSILYARWDGPLAASQPAPAVDGNRIRAKMRFPRPGSRARIRIGLARKPARAASAHGRRRRAHVTEKPRT